MLASAVLMVEPRDFGFNQDTAQDNAFQHHPDQSNSETRQLALSEFWAMVESLDKHHLEVITLQSPEGSYVPDAIFPNNWFSSRQDELFIYPMKTANRQAEVQLDVLQAALLNKGFRIDRIHDLRLAGKGVLEGTGVLIFDPARTDVYANLSERCELSALTYFGEQFGYQTYPLKGMTDQCVPIYHTNVLMACGEDFCVVSEPCLTSDAMNVSAVERLRAVKKDFITISEQQMVEGFCGNILQIKNSRGVPLILMSASARNSFTAEQLKRLEKHGELVAVDIPTIEYVGGGSARCMVAEIFLEKNLR